MESIYYVMLTPKQYEELSKFNSEYLTKIRENAKLQDNGLYIGEVSRLDFDIATLEIIIKAPRSPLLKRFFELGRIQDGDFEMRMRQREKEWDRIKNL